MAVTMMITVCGSLVCTV